MTAVLKKNIWSGNVSFYQPSEDDILFWLSSGAFCWNKFKEYFVFQFTTKVFRISQTFSSLKQWDDPQRKTLFTRCNKRFNLQSSVLHIIRSLHNILGPLNHGLGKMIHFATFWCKESHLLRIQPWWRCYKFLSYARPSPTKVKVLQHKGDNFRVCWDRKTST